jgi:hypothetical protein
MIMKSTQRVGVQNRGPAERGSSATRVMVSTFGVLVGLAGVEHGVGEALQGNVAPSGIAFLSWPTSKFFSILGGEPAMSVIPNFLVTGIFAVLVSLIFIMWATVFVQRRYGGLALILLSFVLLAVGGGFGPPLIGIIVGVVATRMRSAHGWWRAHLSAGALRFLSSLWPWLFGACLIALLMLFPGLALVGWLFGVDGSNPAVPTLLLSFICAAFGLLPLTAFVGFARDVQRMALVTSDAKA